MKSFLDTIFFRSNNLDYISQNIKDLNKKTPTHKIFKAINSFSSESEIRYVGGCIRKIINKEKVDDIDLATNLEPNQVCEALGKNNIKYYFIARQDIPSRTTTEFAPPNPDYWVADLCSKTLEGCKLRWGQNGAVNTDGTDDFNKGELQFGGFPNATRLEQTLGG